MQDDFGDRMKAFEQVEAGRRLMPLLPICIRLDGRSFSRYTAKLDKPFDARMSSIMVNTTKALVEETNASMGYTQSDEISLVIRQTDYESQVYFDGKIQKMVSILGGLAATVFNDLVGNLIGKYVPDKFALFDCRIWNVPNEMEAANTLIWRQQDARRNAIQGAARSHFSHKECLNKNCAQLLKMLNEKGVSFAAYPEYFREGTFVRRVKRMINLTAEQLAKIPEAHRPTGPVERTIIEEFYVEDLGAALNKVEVVFEGADPFYM